MKTMNTKCSILFTKEELQMIYNRSREVIENHLIDDISRLQYSDFSNAVHRLLEITPTNVGLTEEEEKSLMTLNECLLEDEEQ